MPKKLYQASLAHEEQASLRAIVKKRKEFTHKLIRARILVLESQGKKDVDIVESLQVDSQQSNEFINDLLKDGLMMQFMNV